MATGGKKGPKPDVDINSDDYDDAGSPSDSSTASGPVYVRQPGFEHHGQTIQVKTRFGQLSSRGQWNTCKKKRGIICVKSIGCLDEPHHEHKPKPKKEPLPMKLRALPQSFWQQPNNACEVSPGSVVAGPLLPSLFKAEEAPSADGMEVQPVTPPGVGSACSTRSEGSSSRILRVSNTDLLFKLFEGFEGDDKKQPPAVVKRGRPKKVASNLLTRTIRGEQDPCLGITATEGLLPFLSMDKCSPRGTLTLVSMRDGDKTVSLPALTVEHNYSQMLSELVVKL